MTKQRERAAVAKEMDTLRGNIQSLARSTNPLAKILDFLQEDVDAMIQERDNWREEKKKYLAELKREEG